MALSVVQSYTWCQKLQKTHAGKPIKVKFCSTNTAQRTVLFLVDRTQSLQTFYISIVLKRIFLQQVAYSRQSYVCYVRNVRYK